MAALRIRNVAGETTTMTPSRRLPIATGVTADAIGISSAVRFITHAFLGAGRLTPGRIARHPERAITLHAN